VVDPSIGRTDLEPILVVGAASRDLDPTDPRGWRLGGAVSYAALTLARLGVPTHALIGVDREAGASAEIGVLRAAGVDVRLVPLTRGPAFDNRETPTGRVQIAHEVSEALPAAAMPADWPDSSTVLLGPVAGELGDEWAATPDPRAFVALAWQGLLRELGRGKQVRKTAPQRVPLLERANAVFVSAEDVRGSAVRLDGLVRDDQRLFVTGGVYGAVVLHRGSRRYVPALRADPSTRLAPAMSSWPRGWRRARSPHMAGSGATSR
jgi:hypothetical protein